MTGPTDSHGLFIPDGASPESAFARTTHLAIMAHSDDLEFWAYHGIEACYGESVKWFGGVTLTDGAGSVLPPDTTREHLVTIRREEQCEAARIGGYSFILQPAFPSSKLTGPLNLDAVDCLHRVLVKCRPETLYLHNPFDRHITHLAVLRHSIAALHRLEPSERPKIVLGCEGWRDLDWLPPGRKIALPVGRHPELAGTLCTVFRSQLSGKAYDLAVAGRRAAHATFQEARKSDGANGCILAIDLTELCDPHRGSIETFVNTVLQEFQNEIGSEWASAIGAPNL